MSFDKSEISDKELVRMLVHAPDAFADRFKKAAMSTIGRYRGHHRRTMMNRKSSTDRVGIYAQKKGQGLKQDKYFPIKRLGKGRLGVAELFTDVGAEIKTRHALLNQLEHGATINRRLIVPFSKHQSKRVPKGVASKRSRKLLKGGKLFKFSPNNSNREFLVQRRGKKRNLLDFHYSIVNTIRIPKRLQFEKRFEAYRPKVLKELRRVFEVLIKKWNRK